MTLKDALREYAKTGKLTVLLPYARKRYASAHEDPRFIQLH